MRSTTDQFRDRTPRTGWRSLSILIPMASILASTSLVRGADPSAGAWPQWRGPDRDAVVRSGPQWPDDLDGLKRRWRVNLGPGYSGPIVTADRVFVAETKKEKWEVVRAFDRRTGKRIWAAQWQGAMEVPFFARDNGDWIRSTPAHDGRSLYVAGMRDVLMCLDAATGAERWRIDFPKRFGSPLPRFGFVCSPLVAGDHVYVQAGASFVKIDKLTGRIAWRTLDDGGGMYGSAFSSPVLATLGGKPQLLVQTRQKLCGVDPESGDVLWSQVVPSFRGMNILTPTVHGDTVFTSTHKNKTFLYAIRRSEDAFSVSAAWSNPGKGYMSSPVILGAFAYLHLGNGRLACVDLTDGETRWRSRPLGKYWSMAARGRRILALNDLGDLMLVDAKPEAFELLDRKHVADQDTWGHLAVAGREIFIRELRAISAFDWSPKESVARAIEVDPKEVSE